MKVSVSLLSSIVILALTAGCSTTRHLPGGETLYTGVKYLEVEDDGEVDPEVAASVASVLEVAPNSALLGSAYRQWPCPWGLWIYNALYPRREKGLRHWLWNRFKSEPTLLSQVNPSLRCQAAEVAMHDEGYFEGRVTCEVLPSRRNPRRARVGYRLWYGPVSRISDLQYMPAHDARVDSIVAHTRSNSLLQVGDRFSASSLEAERGRIASLMVDSGYYAYSSAFVRYMADTTQTPGQVRLRVFSDYKAPATSLRPCRIDSVTLDLDFGGGLSPTHSIGHDYRRIGYRGRLRVRPDYLYDCMSVREGEIYQTRLGSRVTGRLARLNTFRYNNVEFVPLSSSLDCDTLSMLMHLTSTYDYPWTGSLEVKGVYKDNDQVGPGLSFSAQRRNLFGGGELLAFGIDAGYEWNTGSHAIGQNEGLLNSYELGGKLSLSVPRLQLPVRVDDEYPVTTQYGLSADLLRRAGFFQMLRGTFNVSYSFSSSIRSTHSFTPLQLTYTALLSTTRRFDEVVDLNPVLAQSFENQFIPSLRYTWHYDNGTRRRQGSHQALQLSLVEAGGLLDVVMGAYGTHRQQGQRQFLWQPFSQFVKASLDLRHYQSLGHGSTFAARLLAGVAYAYGNSVAVPYSEQFFIGGANSLRGFSIRSIGPGTYRPASGKYAYLDQTGDVKLEANAEWRFPLSGDLYGALFADAGNVWTLRNEENRPGGQLTSSFLSELASDCGFGLRYDLSMLVLRFDIGVPLHDPSCPQGKYYNVSGSFFGNLGYHFAIGYPF